MTKEMCIDPTLNFHLEASVCESPAPLAPAASFAAPPTASASASSDAVSLERHRARFASLILDNSKPASRPRSLFDHNPLALSMWSILPVACNASAPGIEDGGTSSEGGSSDTGIPETPPTPPLFQSQMLHDEVPCGADGMITDLDPGYGVCANYANGNHHLFRWDHLVSGALTSVTSLPFPPDQMLELSNGEILITTHENPGISVIDPILSTESHIAFPTNLPISGTTSGGRSISSLTPTFPKGLVEHGDDIFIATSNLDLEHNDYLPGTVLAYDRVGSSFSTLRTSGYNATSLAISDGLLLVVSSGALNQAGQATTPAFLDVFDPNTRTLLRTVPLGANAAGLGGEMTLSEDGGTLVLPTADNSGRILVVNLATLVVSSIDLRAEGVTGSRVFFNNVQVSADGHYAWVSNFNDGRTYTIDLEAGHRVEAPPVLDSNTLDAKGLSDALLRGRDLFIGRGSEILRVQYQQ